MDTRTKTRVKITGPVGMQHIQSMAEEQDYFFNISLMLKSIFLKK